MAGIAHDCGVCVCSPRAGMIPECRLEERLQGKHCFICERSFAHSPLPRIDSPALLHSFLLVRLRTPYLQTSQAC